MMCATSMERNQPLKSYICIYNVCFKQIHSEILPSFTAVLVSKWKRNRIKENMWSLDSLINYLGISRVGLWQDPSLSHCLCGWKKGSFFQHKVQILKWTNPNNCTYVPNRPQTNTPIRTGFNLLSGLVLAFSQLSKSQFN